MTALRLLCCGMVLGSLGISEVIVPIRKQANLHLRLPVKAFAQRVKPAVRPGPALSNSSTLVTSAASPASSGNSAAAPNFSSQVDLVNIAFSVHDKHGRVLPGLKRGDFRVLDEGRPQQIRFFSVERQVPLTMALVLDTSPSQLRMLTTEQELADEFVGKVIGPRDLAFVVSFDSKVSLLQDLTSSRPMLRAAVDHAHIGGGGSSSPLNPGPFPSQMFSGSSHLWDAIVAACENRLQHQIGRRTVVVVTDGDDHGSRFTEHDAEHALLDTQTNLYAIVASDPGFYLQSRSFYNGAKKLRHLAELTGGRVFDQIRTMDRAFEQIANELRTQYTLAYRPDMRQPDGTFHQITIQVVAPPGVSPKVRARKGYYSE